MRISVLNLFSDYKQFFTKKINFYRDSCPRSCNTHYTLEKLVTSVINYIIVNAEAETFINTVKEGLRIESDHIPMEVDMIGTIGTNILEE